MVGVKYVDWYGCGPYEDYIVPQENGTKTEVGCAKVSNLMENGIKVCGEILLEKGELDNTLIFFTSDHGPHNEGHNPEFFNSNGKLRGIKRDVYEGGSE
jgi:hypothetical protein